jgi:hypothetical protein
MANELCPFHHLNLSTLAVTIVAPAAFGVGGNQQVVGADLLSGRFQFRADAAASGVGGYIQRQHSDREDRGLNGVECQRAGMAARAERDAVAL